VIIIPHINI